MKTRIVALVALLLLMFPCLGGCKAVQTQEESAWVPIERMELDYATQFSVDYYEGGYKLVSLADGSRFLVIPEGRQLPEQAAPDVVPLYQPIENIYLAASASMCLFDAIDGLDAIRFSGTKEDGWYVENARRAMAEGMILFAGKYSEPDYELLLSGDCPLAVESTMIGHASEVKSKLEELGIAVLVDQSSAEPHPLGRTEWIRLYGVLLNREQEADAFFQQQKAYLDAASDGADTGKTAAFFYISSSGRVVARKSGDYVSRMIELAGGHYAFSDLGDPESAMSTVTIEMETFFAAAKDADYLIYNGTIGGEVDSLSQLLAKNELLADFKAVQNGNVWCTSKNMYQETTQLGQMIAAFHQIFTGEADDLETLPFLKRLR